MKFVLNKCYGGFEVSKATAEMLNLKCRWDAESMDRDDPHLIEVVETLGEAANGDCAKLCVVEIPDETTDWEMDDYDGIESITYVVNGKIYHA